MAKNSREKGEGKGGRNWAGTRGRQPTLLPTGSAYLARKAAGRRRKLGGGAGAAAHRPLDFPPEEESRGRNQSSGNTKNSAHPA